MSTDTNSSNGNGVGFMGILTILFIGLKLTGYISWPWAWVVSPILIPLGIGGILLFLGFIINGFYYLYNLKR